MASKPYFHGTITEPTNNYSILPVIDEDALTAPENYKAGPELSAAVNVALTLGMPLLLTGAPGCGKSELARRIAWELGFPMIESHGNRPSQLLKFVVKSTTEARDLFYSYDTVGRFHAAQVARYASESLQLLEKSPLKVEGQPLRRVLSSDPVNFIEYQALGLAILRAKGRNGSIPTATVRDDQLAQLPETPCRSLVLIDEIDKAPRDVPNDILNEIEHLEFIIPELGGKRIGLECAEQQYRPVVIITSNSERDLPQAFLRRCVYFHVTFPPFAAEAGREAPVTVEDIVASRLGARFLDNSPLLQDALCLCRFLRQDNLGLIKQPSLAEILNYLSYLRTAGESNSDARSMEELPENLRTQAIQTTLLKTREDQERTLELYRAWQKQKSPGRVDT